MSDDKVSDAAKAIAEIAKAVPVYQDAIQPAAKQVGKTLETAIRAVNVALSPLRGFIWSIEQLEEFIAKRVAAKLKDTPDDAIITPKASVVVPALDAVRLRADEPDLQDMFANLIASAMDQRVAARVFPAFVDMLKQITPDEAKLLRHWVDLKKATPIVTAYRRDPPPGLGLPGPKTTIARHLSIAGFEAGCEQPMLVQSYLDNLGRLGLIEVRYDPIYADERLYVVVENHPKIREAVMPWMTPNTTLEFERYSLIVTSLGIDFMRACVVPYGEHSKLPASNPISRT
jgi:hypothetical protein